VSQFLRVSRFMPRESYYGLCMFAIVEDFTCLNFLERERGEFGERGGGLSFLCLCLFVL